MCLGAFGAGGSDDRPTAVHDVAATREHLVDPMCSLDEAASVGVDEADDLQDVVTDSFEWCGEHGFVVREPVPETTDLVELAVQLLPTNGSIRGNARRTRGCHSAVS